MATTVGYNSVLLGMRSGARLNNNLAAASITIIYLDYCLTVNSEIEYFWGTATRWSLGSALFVLNRYMGLLGIVPVMFECFEHFLPECYHQYYCITLQTIVGVILILRTIALYGRSRRVVWALSTLGASVVIDVELSILVIADVINVSSAASNALNTPEDIFYLGYCDLSLTMAQGIRSAVGWISLLCVETTIFGLTLLKSMRMRVSLRHGVLRVLFRDGAIYYGLLVLVGAINLVTFLAPGIGTGDNVRGVTTTLTNALSTTLTSRMFLNLRDPDLHRRGMRIGRWTLSHPSHPGSVGLQIPSVSRANAAHTLSFRRSVESETGTDVEMEDGADADLRGQAL